MASSLRTVSEKASPLALTRAAALRQCVLKFIGASGVFIGLGLAAPANAQPVLIGSPDDGKGMQLLVDAPPNARALLLLAPLGDEAASTVTGAGPVDFAHPAFPLIRDRERLARQGVGVATIVIGAHANRFSLGERESRAHLALLERAIPILKSGFPGARVVLTGLGSGAVSAMSWIVNHADSGFDRVLFVGGQFADYRNVSRPSSVPVLMIQSATSSCPRGSIVEAQEVATVIQAEMVTIYDSQWDTSFSCALDAKPGLVGHDAVLAEAIGTWISGQKISGVVGDVADGAIWHERVVFLELLPELGGGHLESTVYLPDARRAGPGPYPLMVFHHGDIPDGAGYTERQTRLRELPVAREFLEMGYAVAVPERPGVGKSEGRYEFSFKSDVDPTDKGRLHGAYAIYTTGVLRLLPSVDRDRVVISGQSAGGYAVLAAASTDRPWLRGAIDFSGGVTNLRTNEEAMGAVAQGGNSQMTKGFEVFGRSSRVPVEMVFAENDSRYSAQTIRSAVDAWIAAGGRAHLDLYPPISEDGHFVYHHPVLWRDDVRRFLGSLQLPATELPAALKP